jgi:hypothetical protein
MDRPPATNKYSKRLRFSVPRSIILHGSAPAVTQTTTSNSTVHVRWSCAIARKGNAIGIVDAAFSLGFIAAQRLGWCSRDD